MDSQNDAIHEYVDRLLTQIFKKIDKPIIINKYDLKKIIQYKAILKGTTTDAYFFFVWGQQDFRRLLKNNLLFNKRKVKIVFYLNDLKKSCDRLNQEIERILALSWMRNRVHTVLVNTPCDCYDQDFYYYDNFYFDKTWGKVKRIPIDVIEKEGTKLFSDLQDFKGYGIKTSIFPRVPTSIKYKSSPWYVKEDLSLSNYYGGLDGLTLVNMAYYLNFTPVMTEITDGYGWKTENGTFVGSLAEIIYNRVDLSANSRFYEQFESDKIEVTDFITAVYLCFIVPKSERIPQWMEIFTCFSFITWILIVATLMLLSLAWFLIQKAEFHIKSCKHRDPNLCLSLYSVVFLIQKNFLSSFSGRILLFAGLCLNIILTAIFQGSLATSFSIISFYPDVDSLDALLKSNLLISTTLNIFNNETSPTLTALGEKKTSVIYKSSLDRAAYYKDVCAIERKIDAELLLKTQYIDKDGFPLLHIVNGCPIYIPLVYIVPKGSPFLPAFNTILGRFKEAGLTEKWYKDYIDIHLMESTYRNEKNLTIQDSTYASVSFSDIQAACYFFLVCIIASLLMFIGEILIFRMKGSQSPSYIYKQRRYINIT